MTTYNHKFLSDAMFKLRPDSKWSVLNGELRWEDNIQEKPSDDEIDFCVKQAKIDWEKTTYQRQRAPEYPSITEQLDDLFHVGAFSPEMTAKIQAVKDKYPKSKDM